MKNIFTPFFLLISFVSFSQDGVLDGSFGTLGKQTTPLVRPVVAERQRIHVLSNGKILQVFAIQNASGTNNDFGLVRYNADGSLDGTFGTGGLVTTDFGADDYATSIAVTTSGKIVVAGYSLSGSPANGVFAVARYTASGAPDNTFDGDGKLTTAIGTDDAAYAVLANDAVTIVAGFARIGTNYQFAITRYNNAGVLDATFDGDGKKTTAIGIIAQITSMKIQTDQKIVVAGFASPDGIIYQFAAARYIYATGALDNTFDGDGIVTTTINNTIDNDIAYALAIDNSTGKIILAGATNNGADNDFAIVRYTPTGGLDPGFGAGGIVTKGIGPTDDIAYSLALQVDGKILVAGATADVTGFSNDFVIARYTNSGNLDNTFNGGAGYNIIDFGSNDIGYDIYPGTSSILFGGVTGTSLGMARIINSSITLPVNLITFSASKQNTAVQLNWQTTGEQNSLLFEIERSSDGVNYSKLGEVLAGGNTSNTRNYSFQDAQPLAVNFYRLRLVDVNGRTSYSKVVVVRFDSKSGLLVFPNPVKNVLNLQLTQPAGKINIQLFDASGRMVKNYELQSSGSTLSTSIDVSNLVRGVYLLKLNDQSMKIIKD